MAAAGGHSGEEDRAAAAVEAAAGLEFCCKYCDRKFGSKHALGGHQRAHRMERAMDWTAKRRRRGGFMDYPFFPFDGFSPIPAGAGAGQVNYWYQAAAARPPYFLPAGHSIPSPEIPARPPHYAYPFPPAVPEAPPVENHSPYAQVFPAAMTVSGANTFPGGSVPANNSAGSMVINSNPRNTTPEIIKDGELDLN